MIKKYYICICIAVRMIGNFMSTVISCCRIGINTLCICLAIASSRVRKSSCVKEVEKIQQRRIERRAAQQLIREQQEQECDMSVPTWEFSAMIRYSFSDRFARLFVAICAFVDYHELNLLRHTCSH